MINFKNMIFKNFNLDSKEKEIVEKIVCEKMDLKRCDGIIKTMLSLRLANDSLLSFLCYQLYKVEPEKADLISKELRDDAFEMFETFKIIKDITQLAKSEEAEDIRNMFLALSKDLRVVIIKLSGIMFDIEKLTPPLNTSQKSFVKNVRNIFAPLCERLGLGKMKSNMEDHCLRNEKPKVFNELSSNIVLKKEDNQKQILITKAKLEEMLKELKIEGEIQFRQKHISSVFKKLQVKKVNLGQIYDLIAMRVLVESVDDCYAVFGKIHSIYKPMQGRVKDYIANVKPNGYKSLHTTIIAENNRPIEIQIRTFEMHKFAEFGIAAHWIYKEKRQKTTSLDRKLSWFRDILDNAQELSDGEFIETLKTDLYEGEIFVQSPKGKVIQFPEGAIIIDFAYAIHSDVGNNCVGGKINNKMRPLTTKLKNGDVVEIITNSSSKGPSRDWLKIVKTSFARSRIRNFFKSEMKEENIANGKVMLDEYLHNKKIIPSKVMNEKYVKMLIQKYNMQDLNELYASIGSSAVAVGQVGGRLISYYNKDHDVIKTHQIRNIEIKKRKDGIMIDGASGLLIKYAQCCNPVIGDEIVGYISHGQGVTIHRKSCSNIKYLDSERLICATFENNSTSEFNAVVKGVADDLSTSISKITTTLAETKINIKAFEFKKQDLDLFFQVVVGVKNSDEILKIVKTLEMIKGMKKVYRES